MRALAIALLITLAGGSVRAQSAPTTTLGPRSETSPGAQQLYERERKSPGLALTLETLCPIAGAGTLYAGREGDKAGFLAILSGLSAGAAVGSVFWLLHLDAQHSSGVSRAENDVYTGAAITVLVTSGIVYLLARASGISLASQATDEYNGELQQRLLAP